jgi:phage terminase large subunit GpA-like protein
MFAFPTDAVARRFSKERWQKLVDGAEVLTKHKPSNSGDFTNLTQSFDSCSVFFTGVGSAAQVSSEPISLLIADEVDKFPGASQTEAGALALLEERTKSFVYKLIVRSSTPTVATGNIWKSFRNSDAREYFVQCPHCKEWIVFKFSNLKWYTKENDDDEWDKRRVAETARYYCQECGNAIDDVQRRAMINNGQWRATNLDALPSHRGYKLSSLYAPSFRWGDIAVKFIECKNNPEELQNFINSWLAETWEEEAYNSDPEQLSACARDYPRREKCGVVRVMTVDVQRRDLRFNVRGYDEGGSYLIDWGTLSDFETVRAYQEKYDCSFVGIDINYRDREQEVYDAIFEHRSDGWLAIVGTGDRAQTSPVVEKAFNAFVGKRKSVRFSRGNIKCLMIKSSVFKGEIARRRTGTASNWYVYRNVERGYVRELFAEVQAEKFEKGKRVYFWKQLRPDNHQFDLECYQLAIADWAKLHKHGAIQFSPRGANARIVARAENSVNKIATTDQYQRPGIVRRRPTRSKK